MTIRLAVSGACGKMGARVRALAAADARFTLVQFLERDGHPQIGAALPAGPGEPELAVSAALTEACDVVVDFSGPEGFRRRVVECVQAKAALVTGTTGLTKDDEDLLVDASSVVPVLHAPNMSFGVQVLCRAVEEVARRLPAGFDVEVVEAHHGAKVDAPSGTALQIVSVLEGARRDGGEPVFGRHGKAGPRRASEIGVHAVRGGDVIGEHTVHFLGPGERLELVHRCTDREVFARGALFAAAKIAGAPPGRIRFADIL